MAKKLPLNRCWQHVRITVGEGYIEVREIKRIQTLVATVVIGFAMMMGYLLFFVFSKSNLSELMFTGTVLTLVPIIWLLAVYRLPRGLRLYPEQQAAKRYRTIYGLCCFSKWTKLQDCFLVVKPVTVYSMQAPDGKTKTAIALTGVLHATGIIGTILSLGVTNELQERQETGYAVTIEGSNKPLALFTSREYPDRVIEMYGKALENKLDGYRPAPNRFEKPPGA